MTTHTTLIAEVGSNHGGDLDTALAYIQKSAASGADMVKFQTLIKDQLWSRKVWKNGKAVDNPIYATVNNDGFPEEWHQHLKDAADAADIEFFSAPFYLEAVDVLEAVGVSTYKIASGDITFLPLLERVGATGKRVILSTGASHDAAIERALETLTKAGAGEITLLHCVANYPPEWGEMNLRSITTMQQRFGLPVGLSDHSPGWLAPTAAVTLGATVIEKHVTIDQSFNGPDHHFAMTFESFHEMATQIRLLEQALGNGRKAPMGREIERQRLIRRGVYDPVTYAPTDAHTGIWLRPEHEQDDK